MTQADLDHGTIVNTATAQATDPSGTGVTSPPSTATASATQSPSLTLVKSAAPTSVSAAGASVAYSFKVTNGGNVTVTGLTIADTFTAPAGPVPTITCPVTTLAPGASTTCTATYLTTQADVDKGSINNSATANGTDPAGHAVASPASTAVVTVGQTPSLVLVKSAAPTSVTTAGASVAYSFKVTNSGNVTVTGLTIADTFTAPAGPVPTITCPVTTLAPGASTTCTATYVTTQADIDNGTVKNSATASANGPTGTAVTSNPSSATVTANRTAALTLTKSANPTTVTAVGQTVNYSFLVRNTGNVTITGVSIADSLTAPAAPAPTVTCPVTALAPAASTTCTAAYATTQADLDNASINNSATASGTDPAGNPVVSPTSTATVLATQSSGLTITKSASPTTITTAGTVVAYSFLLKNTGNVTLTALAVADTFTAPAGPALTINCPTTTLAPGASTTCTASYTATQADVDHGAITNAATATGHDPAGHTVTSNQSTAVVTATPAPSISVVKSANPTTVTTAGQTVAYSFLVKNTGNVTISGVAITDTFTAPAGPALAITCPVTTLAPNATTTCTATYTVTQADVNHGTIANSATAGGTTPGGNPVTSPPSIALVTVVQSTGLTLTKTASPTTVTAVGQTVTYSFAVKNTGNVTLTGLAIADTFTAPAAPALTVTCPTTALAPGVGTTCTATYTVTQADLDNGAINNSAGASALDPASSPIASPTSTATVTAGQTAGLTLVKSANPTTVATAGATVSYSFKITNSGNVTVHNIAIADTFTAPAGPALTIVCPVTTLAPAASTTCTASYTVTQADVDHGTVGNSATVSGLDPAGTTVTSPPSTATVTITPAPALTLTKSANPTSVTAAGATVTYSFLVKNTGNVTVTGVSIADTFTAPAGPGLAISCPVTTLAPTVSTTCTATYAVSQADVDNGAINNSATAGGHSPSGSTVTSPVSTATVSAAPAPALTLVKSADQTTVTGAGQSVTYSFLVTNTGNVTVSGLAVADTFTAPAGPPLTVSCPTTTLAPAASTTCTAVYTTTQADVDHGTIKNTATVSGTSPAGVTVTSPPSTVTVTATPTAGLTVAKSATPASVSTTGATVDYSFLVTNTGNVTISGVTIADTFTAPAGPALAVTCPTTTLAPHATVTCTATYLATQADIDNGSIDNSATAGGTDPQGHPVTSPPSTAAVTATAAPALTLTKTVSPASATAAGQSVTYSFAVQNTGNVTITGVSIADTLAAPAGPALAITCPPAPLVPGATATCTAPYVVNQADVDAGAVHNSATASGLDPAGDTVTSNVSTATVTIAQTPALSLAKSASPTSVSAVGQSVTYTFALQNTGNVTLTAPTVADTFTAPAGPGGSITCAAASLAPGATTTCTSVYAVTQADLDAGSIANTAVASATSPGSGTVASNPSGAAVSVNPAAGLTLTKTASPTHVTAAGDLVTYSFAVTNTGNLTIHGLSIADTFTAPAGPVPAITCPATTLAPGAATTCTATYPVTVADVVRGRVDNSAIANGIDARGTSVASLPSTATVNISQVSSLTLTKSASPVLVTAAGQPVTYSFLVTNSGNLPITNVTIADTLAAPAGPALAVTCPATSLLPGVSTTCTAVYPVTQADVDNATITNSATANGTDSNGAPVGSPVSTATVTANPAPALTVTKSGTPTTVTAAGQVVTYSFAVRNIGNVTVSGLTIADTFSSPAGPGTAPVCPVTTLAPNASTICTSTYAATQADIDHGSIANTATASGVDPSNNPVTSGPSTFTVTAPPAPALTLVKAATTPTTVTTGRPADRLHIHRHEHRQRHAVAAEHRRLADGSGRPGAGDRVPGQLAAPDRRRRLHRHVHRHPGRRRRRQRVEHRHRRRADAGWRSGHVAAVHRDRRHHASARAHDREVGRPGLRERGRPDDRLHVRGHQHRQRHAAERRRDRCPDGSRRRVEHRPGLPGRRGVDGAR